MSGAAAGKAGGKAVLSQHARDAIDAALKKYPPERRRSAVLTALHEAQHDNHGHLTTELMDAVAEHLGLPNIQVYEVASFYSMFETSPCGRHSVSVCKNISCMLRGSDEILAHIERKYGVKLGESTKDGRFLLKKEEECLAACAGAPMMMVDHKYYEDLTIEKVDQILGGLE
jgi:NADH-quinone oxidoreductase subunit E